MRIRPRVHRLAGGIRVAQQHVRHGVAALHTRQGDAQRGANRRVILDPAGLDDVRHVQDDDDLLEARRFDLLDELLFHVAELEVARRVLIIRALGGHARERQDRGIGRRSRRGDVLVRQRHLADVVEHLALAAVHHQEAVDTRVVRRVEVGVLLMQPLVQADFAGLLLRQQAVPQAVGIGRDEAAGAAAAVHVVDLAESEDRHGIALRQRQRLLAALHGFVLEQDHTLLGDRAGQLAGGGLLAFIGHDGVIGRGLRDACEEHRRRKRQRHHQPESSLCLHRVTISFPLFA